MNQSGVLVGAGFPRPSESASGHGSASAPTINDHLYLTNWQSAVCFRLQLGIKKSDYLHFIARTTRSQDIFPDCG
ncbi:hypothetical protein NIES22_33150 [Calothrix brevissima NIES-22]|nr:hypothetical protein NIES22_33150 [Calothrix brevissima NIES-22]